MLDGIEWNFSSHVKMVYITYIQKDLLEEEKKK